MRETIKIPLAEFEEWINEPQDDWKWSENEEVHHDMNKGITDMRSIRMRISDGKYFAFEYATSHYHKISDSGLANNDPMVGEEVFPIQVTTTVYK